MLKSIEYHLFHAPNSGYIICLVFGAYSFIAAWFVDYFIDESDSLPMSEEDKEKYAIKATKVTRPIVAGVSLLIAMFGIWKMWQP